MKITLKRLTLLAGAPPVLAGSLATAQTAPAPDAPAPAAGPALFHDHGGRHGGRGRWRLRWPWRELMAERMSKPTRSE